MVTRLTRRSAAASIITGPRAVSPARRRREFAEEFGVAGKGEAGVVKRGLGDRRGDEGVGLAGYR